MLTTISIICSILSISVFSRSEFSVFVLRIKPWLKIIHQFFKVQHDTFEVQTYAWSRSTVYLQGLFGIDYNFSNLLMYLSKDNKPAYFENC